MRYVRSPTDGEVGELFGEATVFLMRDLLARGGFCLPTLESMATGGAVVCTRRARQPDFCVDGESLPDAGPTSPSAPRSRGCSPIPSCARAPRAAAGIETAAEFAWERRIDALGVPGRRSAQPRPELEFALRRRRAVRRRYRPGKSPAWAAFAQELRCPACRRDHTLVLEARASSAREVREEHAALLGVRQQFAVLPPV